VRVTDLQCPARIVLALVRPADPIDWAATYEAPVDLEGLADSHRGELVLVVGDHPFADDPVVLEVDVDGRRQRPWPPA